MLSLVEICKKNHSGSSSKNSFFPKNHKGSHVGLVLSFVMFITFLLFLYSIIEPSIKTQKDKQSLLDYLEKELIENFISNMTIVTINVNEDENPNKNCIELKGAITEIGISSKIIVKNKLKEILSFYISEENLQINRNDKNNLFFKIYHSGEFEDINGVSTSPCITLKGDKEEYSFGLTKIEEYVFETKIKRVIEEYEKDSERLKERLKIPLGTEFGFSFEYSNGSIIGTEEKEVSISVYAEEIPIQYIDNEANINSGFLSIRVW